MFKAIFEKQGYFEFWLEFAETASTQPNSKIVHLHNSKAKLAVLPGSQPSGWESVEYFIFMTEHYAKLVI